MANVKVRILKDVGRYTAGTTVEVPEAEVVHLVTPRKHNDGTQVVERQMAMLHTEWEKLKSLPFDAGGLSQGEMAELGMKNVVKTEIDPKFEADLERKRKAAEKQQKKEAKKIAADQKKQAADAERLAAGGQPSPDAGEASDAEGDDDEDEDESGETGEKSA